MRFKIKETAQDVILCCCILHNVRKMFDLPQKQYADYEYRQQIQISENIQRQPHDLRLQNYLIDHYFVE